MRKPRRDREEPSIRRPPAFQEYGADLLALERVKLMSLAERGLLATMRWMVWSNDSLPAKPKQLALVLGLDADDVRKALTPAVLSFFAPSKDDPDRIICPELAAQLIRLLDRANRQMRGTLNSHIARKEHRKDEVAGHDGNHIGTHGGSGVASEMNRTALNRTALAMADQSKANPNEEKKSGALSQGATGLAAVDPFVAEINAADTRERERRVA